MRSIWRRGWRVENLEEHKLKEVAVEEHTLKEVALENLEEHKLKEVALH